MQLLRITTIPIKIKMNVESAKLKINQEQAKMHQRTYHGRLSLTKQDIKVRIDTYEARKSMGRLNVMDATKAAANRGIESAQAATAEYAELGNKLAQAYKGVTIPDIAYSKMVKEPTTQMVFLPSVGAQLSWEGGTLETEYQPDQVETEWETGSAGLEYVPGDLKFEVEQYPSLQIEYMGSPNYVPPSSNPDYKEENKEEDKE
jgi:hypothetical protein